MNRPLKTISFLIITLLFSSCAKDALPVTATEETIQEIPNRSRDVEEAVIYSLLLNRDPADYLADSPTLIILNETELGADAENEYIFKREPTLKEETLENLRANNQQKQVFNQVLSLNKPYEIISSAEMDLRINENPNWLITYTVTTFSKIGFDQNLDQALVYMEHYCGGECASGNLYFLVRHGDYWEIRSNIVSWVS